MAKREKWSVRVGPHGATVTVQERVFGGNIRIGGYDPRIEGTRWASLRFKVRDAEGRLLPEAVSKAKKEAVGLSNQLIRGEAPLQDVTLGELLTLFEREVVSGMHGRYQNGIRCEIECLRQALGRHLRVQNLSVGEWNRLRQQRATGEIDARGRPVAAAKRRPVSERAVAKTLKTLRQVCRFGKTYRRHGRPLLSFDPTEGLELPSNPNPKRPVCTDERYEALLRASLGHTVRRKGKRKPSYLPTLLVLCAETGRRIGAVVALRWEDWKPEEGSLGRIRWRADNDKLGRESVTPVTLQVREALERHREACPALAGWMFPAPDSEGHIKVPLASRWFRRCEELAGLEHIPGLGYHSLRRAFATKRKGSSIQDVAALGGWKGTQVLQNLYQQADLDAMERALLEGQDVRLKAIY